MTRHCSTSRSSTSNKRVSIATMFGVSEAEIKWAMLVFHRCSAFGFWLPWQDCLALCECGMPDSWKAKSGDSRAVMWDTTDVKFRGQSSDQCWQSLLFSKYYGGWVARAGVGMTACGWIIPGALSTPVSDRHYLAKAGIIQAQKELAERDHGPPLNITDKAFIPNFWHIDPAQALLTPSWKKRD